MAINFPNNPQTGEVFNIGTKKWKWTGVSWTTVDVGTTITQAGNAIYTPGGVDAVDTTVEAKLRQIISPKDFGAVGDGVADDTEAVQNAIYYASSLTDTLDATDVGRSNICVDLVGGLYGISDTLQVYKNIHIRNGAFVALSTPTTTNFMFRINTSAERFSMSDVDFDGGLNGTTRYADLIESKAKRVSITNVMGIHFPNYGIRFTDGQEARILNVLMREWQFDEAGTTDDTLRTAKAFSVETADMQFINCVAAQSLYPFYVSGSLNSFVACHAYNGAAVNPTMEAHAFYIDNTDNTLMTGCYIDNGNLYIKDSFNHNICGTHFQRTGAGSNNSGIFIDTSATSDQVDGLCVTGCTFNGTFTQGAIEFGGTGTYATDTFKEIQWVSNTFADGSNAWYKAKFGSGHSLVYGETEVAAVSSYHTIKGLQGIKLSADYNNDSGLAESKITFATDGVDKWSVVDTGTLTPEADLSYNLGSNVARLQNTFSNKFTLVDGISEPATIAGHAQLFVDSADNNLKVKFGDGSVVSTSDDTLPSVTETATFSASNNNINATGIGTLTDLAIGDVIEVSGSVSNDNTYTVEDITNNDNIIVNAAHAGGLGSKSLTDESATGTVTVQVIARAKDAPLGLGQGWVSYSSGSGDRSHSVTYTNSTGRPISILINKSTQGLSTVQIDGTAVTSWRADGASNLRIPVTFIVSPGSTYLITNTGYDIWSELR